MIIVFAIFLLPGRAPSTPVPFLGTSNDPAISVPINLHNPDLHPRQLAYDARRDGIWFWTSMQDRGITFDNRVYFYDLARRNLRSWPIYSPDWSSQLLAGLAIAPNGDIWIGWNFHLLVFHPNDGSYHHYELPARTRYPLPTAVIGDLPADLGIADVAVAGDGTVWIARYASLSLTEFDPGSATFREYPLPTSAGDPDKLAIGPEGDIIFTTDLSADHPGYVCEKLGEYNPRSGQTHIFTQTGRAIAISKQGDLYVAARDGYSASLVRLDASERASIASAGQASAFTHGVVPFAIDETALATDIKGRIWMAVAGKPEIAVLDPATGHIQRFQYAAPGVAAQPAYGPSGAQRRPANPNDVWVTHIAAMVTDGAGHLWYVREGSDTIEEVAA